jgi:hypothetical protein
MQEGMRWSTPPVTLDEIGAELPQMVEDMALYDPRSTLPLLAGLLTARGVRVTILSSVSGLAVREDEPLWLAEAGLRRLAGNR